MNIVISLGLFVIGLVMVIFFAEQLIKGVVGTSLNFGISAFLISIIFIGFDPDNLSVGIVASYNGISGIVWGSIIGAAMVAIAFAFGVSAFFAPMKFEKVSKEILAILISAVLLLGALGLDGQISRVDGFILLVVFVLSLVLLVRLSKQGLDIQPSGEVAESLDKAQKLSKWQSIGFLLISLLGIVIGSELLVTSSQNLIGAVGLSDTIFGMTILAFLVSIEEIARELPAAIKGRPDISFGNVVGSILAMFLFNAGIVALLNPIKMNSHIMGFYLPYALATVIILALFMMSKNITRWAGAFLVVLYLGFIVGSYLIQ